jgi:hypothetical protein
MMFLLNLEIAFLSPPFGQNLFVTSFRFNKPMASLYRISLPFLGILVVGLLMIMYIPSLSTVAVQKDIAEAKEKAAKIGEPPREAWMMECVQEDRNNPLPCTAEDKKKWGAGKEVKAPDDTQPDTPTPDPSAEPGVEPESEGDAGDKKGGDTDDDLLDEMMGDDKKKEPKKDADGGKEDDEPKKGDDDSDDKLLDEMLK